MSGQIYIYLHRNLVNGKKYFGQTNNVKERWSSQGSRYKGSPHFYRAIQKYGWDNFEHIILCSTNSHDIANSVECFLIERYNTNDPTYGYNISPGGVGFNSRYWTPERRRQKSKEKKLILSPIQKLLRSFCRRLTLKLIFKSIVFI